MERFIATRIRANEALGESVSQLNSKFEVMTTHQKMIENQIAQIAQQVSHLSRPQGHLPGQPETNPKDQMNAITLRSGKELDGPPSPMRKDKGEIEDEGSARKQVPIAAPSERAQIEKPKEVEAENTPFPTKPYKPSVPYPQMLVKAMEEHKYGKFLDMLKKFHINIPFLEAIIDIPSYAKFLKDLLSNKGKLLENASVSFTEECSAIIQDKLSPKLSDPRSFSIPCSVRGLTINRALCDLGASVSLMPYSICKWGI